MKDYNLNRKIKIGTPSSLFNESKRRNSFRVKPFTELKIYDTSPEKIRKARRSSTLNSSSSSPNYLKTTENTRIRNKKRRSLFTKDD